MLGFGQDVYAGSDSVLRKQVQNYAAHGMVGTFFYIDTPLVLGYTIKITADNRRKIWPQIFAWSSAQGWM